MSLIQEALKRQQEDGGEGQPEAPPAPVEQPSASPEPPAPPAGPPPPPTTEKAPPKGEEPAPPDAEAPPPAESGSRVWVTLVAVLVVMVLLIGGGIWGMMFAFRRLKSASKPSEQPTETVTVIPEPEPAVSPEQEPETEELLKTQPVPEPAEPVVESADLPEGESLGEGGADVVPGTEGPEMESEPAAPEVTEPEPEVEQVEPATETREPQVEWPSLTLSGAVGIGSNGSAIFDSEIVSVGETIEGVKVISIGKQGVKLEYEGETQLLKVGNSTR